MIRGRKKITWTAGEESRIKTLRPHPYVPQLELPASSMERYRGHLVPGALWFVVNPLAYERPAANYKSHHHSYLTRVWEWAPDFKPGAMAVYAGPVRVEEDNRTGSLVRIERHSFIIGGTRYITAALGDFVPAEAFPE
jgi:hypothetical protein